VMKQVMSRMSMREVAIAYGMTETSPVSTQTRADDSLDRRVSTVGRVMPRTGCTPATWPSWMKTGTWPSPGGSRTW
jgi:acyl-CoA synthetase (AMP-forming)/AMP-acid ligase II